MRPAIRVDRLSKQYRLGTGRRTPDSQLRELLSDGLKRLVGRAWGRRRDPNGERPAGDGTFWALRDVSFEVRPGEVVGIIGRNGAGKSTLLKILSQIVEPTSGRAEVRGRMGSLLEVGTGFNPELTGRENVYLNGSILGMSRREIDRKFDEIIDFSGVEQFLDTPVKRYSSGMYVRLAFAVAAHLEPEILLVDEVLAVGDLAFQQKCLGKIRDVSRSGRTVLLVTHNMASISGMCDTALTLCGGRLVDQGPAHEQVGKYIASLRQRGAAALHQRTDRSGLGKARIVETYLRDAQGNRVEQILSGSRVDLVVRYRGEKRPGNVGMHVAIYNDLGTPVTYLSNDYTGDALDELAEEGAFVCHIPELPLAPGQYLLNMCLTVAGTEYDHIAGAAGFEVLPGFFFNTGKTPPASYGHYLCHHSWSDLRQTATAEEGQAIYR
jgi:lipopolysaccharide transport system ATP-binding protein